MFEYNGVRKCHDQNGNDIFIACFEDWYTGDKIFDTGNTEEEAIENAKRKMEGSTE